MDNKVFIYNFFPLFMHRLLLWDCDNRSYSYYVEVSGNSWNWILVADKTTEACRSWQTIRFHPPRPVVFIRIVGTHNTANEVGEYMDLSFHVYDLCVIVISASLNRLLSSRYFTVFTSNARHNPRTNL